MIRRIIEINQEKCNGCGLCANACHEGAIGMIEGKATLLRDDYCDGLGDCLPVCPTGAITFVEREAEAYDEAAVQARMQEKKQPMATCPGSRSRLLEQPVQEVAAPKAEQPSCLRQWPVQIKLAPVKAPYFDGAKLLIAADCTAYAYGSFHSDLMRGKVTLIGCPKLDLVDYSEKTFTRIREDYLTFAGQLPGNLDIRFVPLSALEGDNVASQSESMPWYSGPTLLEVLETVEIQRVVDAQPMRFPVQYVNRPNLDFRGYAGTLASGRVEVGQRVKVLPSGVESNVARIVTFDGDREEAFAGEAITLVLTDEIDISRGDLLLAADEALPAVQSASVDVVWMAEQPLSPGQSYDIKIAGKKTRARIDGIRYQVDINNLTQREVENLPLNGIGLVDLTFDEPLVLDRYQQNPVTGGLIFIDRLSNVTVGAGMVHEPVSQATAAPSEFSAFELELNALVRRHFPHWGARDLLGDK